jgi:type III pantothenate kinase
MSLPPKQLLFCQTLLTLAFMILVFDIGNSDITIGLWNKNAWQHIWRIPSRPDQPELYYGVRIRDQFLEARLLMNEVQQIVVSSVVPTLTEKVRQVLRSLFGKEPLLLGPKVYERLPMEILNPYEIGSDLVANAAACFFKYGKTSIVVDFGTALTFTTVSAQGKILGVSIVPGLRTAIKALTQNTAKLFDVPLEMPQSALGISTVTAIQSGLVIGYDGLVRQLVTSIRQELNTETIVVATGGLSFVITSLKSFFDVVDPQLTLDGLRLIGERVRPEQPFL